MTAPFAAVMPMAGRGSRFARQGIKEPKPLIELAGRPFFWWAVESLRRTAPPDEMVFVVLDEHCRDFAIDRRIAEHYPAARVVAIPEVTSGAAETAAVGVRAWRDAGPVAVNDCDHAFNCPDLAGVVDGLRGGAEGALLCFRSDSPAYSYARGGADGVVTGTVEKQAVSPFAIAGCYMFASPAGFLGAYDEYRADCPYDELFVSGMFNRLLAQGGRVLKADAARHVSFGTPEERDRIDPHALLRDLRWAEP